MIVSGTQNLRFSEVIFSQSYTPYLTLKIFLNTLILIVKVKQVMVYSSEYIFPHPDKVQHNPAALATARAPCVGLAYTKQLSKDGHVAFSS